MASLQKKWLNKAGFFRLGRKQQKMDKTCLQEARREAIEVNCALFIFIQVQGHIKLSSQEVPTGGEALPLADVLSNHKSPRNKVS